MPPKHRPPHLAKLIAGGKVRPTSGPRHLPKPTKLQGTGKTAMDYIVEDRR